MAVDIGTLRGLLVLDDKFSSALDVQAGKLAQFGQKFDQLGKKMSATGGALTKSITLPLVAIGGAALKMSADFETSLTKIETLVGLSRETVQGFREDVLRLAGETARSPVELADALFFVTSAGLRGKDALEALTASAQAAVIGLGDTSTVADAVTSAMNAYGPSVLSATEATNVLALAVRAGKLEATELAPVLGRLLPTASAMGIAFDDVAGILAVMSRTGLSAAEASTSLNAVMTTLLKPTPKAAEALAEFDLSLADLRATASGPDGVVGVMRQLDEAFKGNDEALTQVVPNVRAFRGFMNVLAQDASVVDDVMNQVSSGVDVLGEGMARVSETTGFKFQQFMVNVRTSVIQLGDVLAPAFQKILEFGNKLVAMASKMVTAFSKLPDPVQNIALAMLGIAAAAGPLLLITGGLISAFGQVATLLSGTLGLKAVGLAAQGASKGLNVLANNVLPGFLTKTIQGRNSLGQFTKATKVFSLSLLGSGGISGALGTVVTFLTGPVGIAVAIGVALLAFKPFRELVGSIIGLLFELAKGALSLVVGAFKLLLAALAPILDFVGAIAGAIADVLGPALTAAAGWVSDLTEGLEEMRTGAGAQAFVDATKSADQFASATEGMAEVFRKFGEEGLASWIKNADLTDQKIMELKAGLGSLDEQGKLTEEEFFILGAALRNTEGFLAAVAGEADTTGDALGGLGDDAADSAKKIADAAEALGLITVEDATDELDALVIAIENNLAPTSELAEIVLELEMKFGDLAGGSDEVAAGLDKVTTAIDQDALAAARLDSAMALLGVGGGAAAVATLEALQLVIEAQGAPTEELAARVLMLQEELATLAEGNPAVQAALEATTAAMGEVALEAAKTEKAIESLGLVSLGDLEDELNAIEKAFESSAGSPAQLEKALEALRKKAEELELGDPGLAEDISELEEELRAAAIAAGRVEDPFKKFADVISDLGVKTLPAALESLEDIPAAISAGVVPTSDLNRVVKLLDDEYGELAKESEKVAAALDAVTDAARGQGAELDKDKGAVQRFTDKLSEGVKGLTDPDNIAGFIGAGIGDIFSGDFTSGISDIVSQIGSQIGGSIGAAFGPIGSIIGKQLGALAGKLVGVIKNLFGKSEMAKVGDDVGRDLGVSISDSLAQTIADESKETGDRVGAIVKNLPAIIEEAGVANDAALSKFVSQARINLNQLDRGTLSSEVAFGQLGESLEALIPKIGEVGATSQTVGEVFEVLDAALGQVATGLATTDDAAKLLNTTFPLLVEQMDNMGAQGVMAIRSLIVETRELGIEVQAITDFVLEGTKKITDGVTTIVDSLGKRISQLPEDLNFAKAFKQAQNAAKAGGTTIGTAIADGVQEGVLSPELQATILSIGTQAQFAAGAIAVAFSEGLAQGVPITQLVGDMKTQLGQLGAVFDELGIKAPESFEKISAFAQKIAREDVAPVIEGIQGMGQALEGLGALGLATQSDFDSFGASLTTAFTQLSAQGLNTNEVFAAIGPQLQQLADLQRDFGFEVDAGTQALLDQASAAGVVKGAQLDTADAVSAGFQGLFDRFDVFLEKQGIATEGMFNFGEQATSAMDSISGATETASTTMADSFVRATATSTTAVQGFGSEVATTYQGITMGSQEAAQSQSDAFVQSFSVMDSAAEATKIKAEEEFTQIVMAAGLTAEEAALAFSEGALGIQMALEEIGDVGGGAFDEIANAADRAAGAAEDRFAQMQNRLVGASIITDTVKVASEQILTIGDAAAEAAKASADAFEKTSITHGIDAEILATINNIDGGPDDSGLRDNVGFGGDGGFQAVDDSGGGFSDFGRDGKDRILAKVNRNIDGKESTATIQLLVDGQVLAETVIKNTGRVLSNKGL